MRVGRQLHQPCRVGIDGGHAAVAASGELSVEDLQEPGRPAPDVQHPFRAPAGLHADGDRRGPRQLGHHARIAARHAADRAELAAGH
jgi:hypothetical protein